MSAEVKHVSDAIASMEVRSEERDKSQRIALNNSLQNFGEEFKSHLTEQQAKNAETMDLAISQCTARIDEQQTLMKTYAEELVVELRRNIQHVMQNDVPSLVGAVLTENARVGAGSDRIRNGGGEVELADKTYCDPNWSRPPGERASVGYSILDATRGETEGQSQLTLPREPLTSLLAGNLVRTKLQDLAGFSQFREDNVALRVVGTPEG